MEIYEFIIFLKYCFCIFLCPNSVSFLHLSRLMYLLILAIKFSEEMYFFLCWKMEQAGYCYEKSWSENNCVCRLCQPLLQLSSSKSPFYRPLTPRDGNAPCVGRSETAGVCIPSCRRESTNRMQGFWREDLNFWMLKTSPESGVSAEKLCDKLCRVE